MRDYLTAPPPKRGQFVHETEFLALDFETTGLDASKETILSAGWVLVRRNRVVLRESGHRIVRVTRALPAESVAIHKITDDRAREGIPLHELLDTLLSLLAGRVLLAHCQRIEKAFLDTACQQVYGIKPPWLTVDTLRIEKKRRERRQQEIIPGDLRLFRLREQYGLPRYHAHNALEDALGAAELFLAQLEGMAGGKPVRLRQVLTGTGVG